MSLLGTLGIVMLTPLFQRLFRPVERLPLGHHIAEIISVTLAAQVATLPIFGITFNQVSFIAPVANILTVPLLALLIVLGLLICVPGALWIQAGTCFGWVAWPLLWYVIHVISWCASPPGAYLSVSNLDTRLA